MHQLRNNKGLTLVELLAVIVILSIVTMFIVNLVTSATKQQIAQSTHNRDIKELSYSLKVITKDFRKSDNLREEIDETTEPHTTWYILQLDNIEVAAYTLQNNQIIRRSSTGQQAIALNVEEFDISGGSITIVSTDGQTATTEITIRSGTK